jgi:hypothetical protein
MSQGMRLKKLSSNNGKIRTFSGTADASKAKTGSNKATETRIKTALNNMFFSGCLIKKIFSFPAFSALLVHVERYM